jgi:hypothetical protein
MAPVICILVYSLLIPLDTYLALILMFFHVIHLQQEIAEASDDAARKYYEETLESKKIGSRMTAVMRAAAKT